MWPQLSAYQSRPAAHRLFPARYVPRFHELTYTRSPFSYTTRGAVAWGNMIIELEMAASQARALSPGFVPIR